MTCGLTIAKCILMVIWYDATEYELNVFSIICGGDVVIVLSVCEFMGLIMHQKQILVLNYYSNPC